MGAPIQDEGVQARGPGGHQGAENDSQRTGTEDEGPCGKYSPLCRVEGTAFVHMLPLIMITSLSTIDAVTSDTRAVL